jgi:hypothetical protein
LDVDGLASKRVPLAVWRQSKRIGDQLVLDLPQGGVQAFVYAEEVVELCGELVCHDSVCRGES